MTDEPIPHRIDPAGRVIMVTGGNRGLGRAIVDRLHADGFSVSVGVRDLAKGREALAPLKGDRLSVHRFDARDKETAASWVAATKDQFGRIDGVINNAGVMKATSIDDMNEENLDDMWEVNVKAPFRLISKALPHLRASGSGRIINVASMGGLRYSGGSPGYSMSKFALVSLTHAVRFAGWEDGVRATALCPNAIDTGMVSLTQTLKRDQMIRPETLAILVSTVLCLPNTASISVLPVNMRLEHTF